MKGSRRLRRTISFIALWVATSAPPALVALEPPTPEQLAEYRRDGSLAERVAAAKRLGNHLVSPRLVWQMRQRLARARLRAAGKPDHEIELLIGQAPPPARRDGLPSKGTPKTIVILVDFPDYPHGVNQTTQDVAAKFFGNGDPADYPYESLGNFYQRSSYGQLTIEGNVLGWYRATQNRSYYENLGDGPGQEALMMEVLNHYDGQGHDFAQYDNDGDGTLDSLFIKWTGPIGAWASFWWAYQWVWHANPGYRIDGKAIGYYVWSWYAGSPGGAYHPLTDIHETGHLLGLPDYYDYDPSEGPHGGVGGLDMMHGNWGDHNCFSKFLLEWVEPTTIVLGAQTITLRPSGTARDSVLMMPGVTPGDSWDEFFMAQYRKRSTGNDPWDYPTDGLVIWHVDARLNASGTDFQYNNHVTAHKLLRLMEADGLEQIEQGYWADAGDFYVPPAEFGPTTVPNSKNYAGQHTSVSVEDLTAPGATMSARFTTGVAPIIAGIPNQVIPTGEVYTHTVSLLQGTDPITWSVVTGPQEMTVDPDGVVTWPDPGPADSNHTVTVRAHNAIDSDTESWELTVLASPDVATPSDGNAVLHQPYTKTLILLKGSQPITWSLVSSPAGMTVDADGVVTWPDPGPADSNHLVTIRATNGVGHDDESWGVTVTAPPVIDGVPDRDAVVGQPYTEAPTLRQGHSLQVTWSLVAGPDGMTINAASGVVSWPDPGPADSVHTVSVRATNTAGYDEESWRISVVATSSQPQISPIDNDTAQAGTPYAGPTPTLIEATPLVTWSLLTAPPGMTIDAASGVVTWPDPGPADSNHLVTIRATNEVGHDDESWRVTVTAPPVINGVPDGDAVVGQPYTETPTLRQGYSLAVTWSLVAGPDGMTIDSGTGVVSWSDPGPADSVHTVTIQARNSIASHEATWQVTVAPPPIIIKPIPDRIVPAGQAYNEAPTLQWGDPSTTVWSLVAGPAGMTINAATGAVSWPDPTHTGSPYTVTIRAQNSAGYGEETWSLTVDPPQWGVTVAISPGGVGLVMVVDGRTYKAPQTFTWTLGSAHQVSVASTQIGQNGSTYLFDAWNDGVAAASRTIVVESGAGYTASMREVAIDQLTIVGPGEIRENESAQYRLRVSRSDGTSDDVTSQASWRLSSSEYADIDGGLVTTREVDSDRFCQIYATYEQGAHSWSARVEIKIVNVLKTRTLSVTTSPATSGQPIRTTHANGEAVTIPVPPAPGPDMVFSGWRGDASGPDNPLRVIMDGDKNVVAVFEKPGAALAAPLPTSWCAIGLGQAMVGCLAGLVVLRLAAPTTRRRLRQCRNA